ncbi:unnamed protein product [Miscanthus lutarioriparius]|uniref:BED-type domain-containing protein n=1 Tax=Miscanthus lutarioriparius TaxID=422564 RepID=A0A811RLQ1_9POAL|nr:unnamed protein product [Miscanthus lutarioriparius]
MAAVQATAPLALLHSGLTRRGRPSLLQGEATRRFCYALLRDSAMLNIMAIISPPSVNNENYDPKKPDKVTCTLCDTEVSGGIKRLKQHLAGGYGDAKMCPKTTTAIRKEMRDYLESNKRRRPLFNEEDDESPEKPADVVVAKIEEIGEDKVVQVITDNGANYKANPMSLLIAWILCLEEIGNLKEFKKPIARAKRVTTFIYRHGRILSLMREKTGADLVRPAATRFATSFLTLKSLHKHRDALKALFVSEEWLGNKLAKSCNGQEVHNIVLSMEFWNSVEDCLRASAPLLIVLRVVDGDERPAMPEVAALMNHAKEKIKLSFATENKKTLLKNIIKIIEKRWVTQMDHPLYGAAPMHTKKRNRLLHKRLNDIVFVSYNRKMKTRFQLRREKKGKNFNPLVIEEFDWDNEWADSSYVHPQGARGCDNGDNGRNLPRNASSKRARNGQSRLAELEEDLGLANEEEEEEDPHDDADLAVWEKKREFRTSDHQKGLYGTWKKATGNRRITAT